MAVYSELHHRVAIVTGAARGIGAAIARGLGKQGCRVAACDVEITDNLRDVCDDISSGSGEATPFQCDVRDPERVTAFVNSVHTKFNAIDILINNAGISRDAVVWRMTDEQWRDVIDVNMTGGFHFMRAVAPIMRTQKSGRIVSVSSINALRGKAGLANYSASKAGIAALTRTVARELGPSGINVNAVAPGLIVTEMTAPLTPELRQDALKEIALGHTGQPEDVADVVVFLCSDSARHITGETIRIDGGQCMG